jgi:hypothetical protein
MEIESRRRIDFNKESAKKNIAQASGHERILAY